MAVGKVESRQLLDTWGEVPLEGPPWRLEWGLLERLTCPCLLLLITDPTHHGMVGLSLAQSLCNYTVRVIIININYYAENCWPNFENLTTF